MSHFNYEPYSYIHAALSRTLHEWDEIIHDAQENVEEKESNVDLVTAADKYAEDVIRGHLLTMDDDASVVGEESGASASGRRTYYVDPIDGTFNFANNLPLYCSAIACEEDDEITAAGAVFPALDMSIHSVKGEGVYLKNMQTMSGFESVVEGSVSETEQVSGSNLFMDIVPEATVETLGPVRRELENDCIIRQPMCVIYGLGMVANGSFDGSLNCGLDPWDVAPGYLFIKEAGGRITDFTGDESWSNVKNGKIVTSNGGLHEDLLSFV